MLNLYNHIGGHALGDEYLKTFARLISADPSILDNKIVDVDKIGTYRIGGDEFALLLRGGQKDVLTFVDALNKHVISSDQLPAIRYKIPNKESYLELSTLKEYLFDCGIASSGDYFQEFQKVDKDLLRNSEMGQVKRFARFLDHVADRKGDFTKAIKRIKFLKTLFETDKDIFRFIYQFSAKGAIGISETQLEALPTEPLEQSKSISHLTADLFAQREESEVMRVHDEFQKRLHQFVKEIFLGKKQ